MKKYILKVMLVAGLIAVNADLRAFTAVTSGSWSNAATWGGTGPGSTVTNQDIIIPVGIAVDLDMNVTFNGIPNDITVNGILTSAGNFDIDIVAGVLQGSGYIDLGTLTFSSALATNTFNGTMMLNVLRDDGAGVGLTGPVTVLDTLALESGNVFIYTNGNLVMSANSNVWVDAGVLIASGGTFTTGNPYDIWYVGSTKATGEEVNSASIRDLHVMLNSNSNTLFLSSNTSVNGELDMTAGHVALNGARLRIYGDLTRNPGALFEGGSTSDLVIEGSGMMTSNLEFNAGATLDELIVSRDTMPVHLATDLTVTGTLRLVEGFLHVMSGATLTIGSGAMISLSDGRMDVDGTFDGSALYNVEYIGGDSASTGVELSGSGINNVTVNLNWHTAELMLISDLTVPGTFSLLSGYFQVYATKTLRIEGDFYQDNNTMIAGENDANLELAMSTSVNDTLWMAYWSTAWSELEIDIPSSSIITFGYFVSVADTLKLMSGRVRLVNYALTVGSNAAITGASETRYIITDSTGALRRFHFGQSSSTYVVYPIGTEDHYCPLAISNYAPSQTGFISARVMHGMFSDGESGTDESTIVGCVDKTWVIKPDSAVPLNMNVKAGWNQSNEVNMFDRNNAYMKGYWSSAWNPYSSGAAAPASWLNAWEIERLGVLNEGAFAVVDSSNLLSVPEPVAGEVNVFPNPATDMINVQLLNPNGDILQYEIYDATGRRVLSTSNSNEKNQIDFSNYEKGVYTMRITNLATQEVSTHQVIKS